MEAGERRSRHHLFQGYKFFHILFQVLIIPEAVHMQYILGVKKVQMRLAMSTFVD
jgi:hypothetical protein